ncbi:MAG TPA: hypothetical protein VEU62_06850 [Bryobacterales bacterium]|nr:hypothetical protein [Bryobacterales bacterium]
MDLPHTLRQLRMEKKWFDQVIASIEQLQATKGFRAAARLDAHLERNEQVGRRALSARSRRRLSRWLREYKTENLNGAAARPRQST